MNEFTYESIETPQGNIVILRSDDTWIPVDTANSDYQAYLAQLENEGI
jgi:hypothetical protein